MGFADSWVALLCSFFICMICMQVDGVDEWAAICSL